MISRFIHAPRSLAARALWAAIGLGGLPGAATAAPAGVTLLESGPASVRFVVEVPSPTLHTVAGEAEGRELRLAGYDPEGEPGEAPLPARVVTVAVPPSGVVSVRASGAATDWREGVRLARLPWVGAGRDGVPSTTPWPAAAGTPGVERPVGSAGEAGAPPARLLEVSWLRDQRVARVQVSPAIYDAARGRLGVHRRIEVEVRFAPEAGGLASGARTRGNDGFEPLYRDVLVNHEQGRSWRRGQGAPGTAGTARAAAATVVPATSIFAGRRWVKISIPQSGFYRVYFGQVRNSALFGGDATIPVDSLRLFAWPGVPVLPEDSYCDSCDFREVAIGIADAGADGIFSNNDNDYFYFYAVGASDWTDHYAGPQDAPQPDTVFLDHPYEAKNYCYLTIATAAAPVPGPPKRIGIESGALADTVGATRPTTFRARAHFEQDRELHPHASPITGIVGGVYQRTPEFWEKWFWASINNTSASLFVETVDLPGLEPSLPARLRLRAWGLSEIPVFQKSPGVADHYLEAEFGDVTVPRGTGWDRVTPWTVDTVVTGLTATGNAITLRVPTSAAVEPDPGFRALRQDVIAVAWFDVFYPRRLEPVGDALAYDSDPAWGKVLYDLGPFTGSAPDSIPRLFDVTDPYAPIELVGAEYLFRSGGWRLRFNRLEAGRRRYRVVPEYAGAIVRPPNTDVVDAAGSSLEQAFLDQPGGDNLRDGHGADYLLIYYDPFEAAAGELVAWRRDRLPLAGQPAPYAAHRVPVSAIYDQFSGGRTDPGAIRNFLRAVDAHWDPRPTYVTILGDASSDFKNLNGSAPAGEPGALVPSYEGGFDLVVRRQYATDDWMLNVNDPIRVIPDFLGGRIPASDAATALAYVRDRVLVYDRDAPLGDWRDRVMLVGDDNEQGSAPDAIYWGHMEQTVALDLQGMPAEVDRAYVYLHTYPDGPNDTKPGAKADIVRHLNEGTLLFNYIGHGSPFKLADESVFTLGDVDGLLTNRQRPTVLVAASCDVGRFNIPDRDEMSLGEQILFNRNGGAVAVISSTELAFSTQNAALNLRLFERVFARDTTTGRFEATLAQGLAVAKTGATNSQKYQLMGDAAVRLDLPRLSVEAALTDLEGNPVTAAARGQTVVVKGQVVDRPGGSLQSLDGLARVLIEDSAPVDTLPNCFGLCFGYPFRASPVFRGDVSVVGGTFQTRFVVPMNARLGPLGRARAYVEVGSGAALTDGVGQMAFSCSAGVAPTDDREGPRITLSFVGGATRVRPDAVLRVDLSDPSGILLTGHVPQNGIIVTVDESSTQRYDITSSFRYAANSYQSGAAFFTLPALSAGAHRIRVSAADNLAAGITAGEHRSAASIDFEVTDQPSLQVTRALLFPNPVRSGGSGSGGTFVVDAPGDSVEALVKIYTVAGRLVRVLESDGGLAQVQIPWDGLDAEGSPLAKGAYLFKVQVFPRGPGGGRRADGVGRFVVTGR